MRKRRIIATLAIVLVAGMLLHLCSSTSSDRSIDAWVCAEDAVRNELKSPSTAKFCSYTDATVTDLGENKYRIKGYVDAQNSFGATVRSNFTVTLTLTEHGYRDATCSFN